MVTKMKKKQILFSAGKISLGCASAIIISTLLGLEYSATAGLITVLSIQNTKKETAEIAVKRIISFIAAAAIAFLSFSLLGYTTAAFTVYLFIFIILCQLFQAQSAIVPVSVLITHILTEKQFTAEILINEFLLLVIGAGIGFLLNLYMRKNSVKMEETKTALDNEIKAILERMADRILMSDKSDYNRNCFDRLASYMEAARLTALENKNNTLIAADSYDILYLEMREKQCIILSEMYKTVKEMDATPRQAEIISSFLKKISAEYHEKNDVNELISEADRILAEMKTEKMPETRLEFENRALLFTLLIRIKEFLSIKNLFMSM